MENWLGINGTKEPFILFSKSHIAAVLSILTVAVLVYLFREKLKSPFAGKLFRWGLILLIIIQEVILYGWYIYSGDLSLGDILPLQICDMSMLLCIILLCFKNHFIYELTYFWRLAGAIQAVLTPDLGNFSFPHIIFFQFFFSHGCIIITCLFMTLAEGLRPTVKSILRVFVFTNVYAACIAGIDAITGGNYLYLRGKPPGGSIMDYLGPWPWYILSLELVALALFFLCYLPFVVLDFKSNKRGMDRSLPM